MKLFEYEAKQIAVKYGVPIPQGFMVSSEKEAGNVFSKIGRPCMLKAQVLVAGRAKAGGIKSASSPDEALQVARSLFGMKIKGEPVHHILVEEKVDIKSELYASIVVDRASKCYTLLLSRSGGIDIEEVAAKSPEAVIKHEIDPLAGLQEFEARNVASKLGYKAKQLVDLASLIVKLYQIASGYDAELVESNPLVETGTGVFLAADLRLLIDDNSLYRHANFQERLVKAESDLTPLELKARERGLAYVELDGDVGIIGNGAGLVMATLDMILDYKGKPANFCDVGGGASEERIRSAIDIVLANERVKVLFINIMGGITRCDDVAHAILKVRAELEVSKPIVIRLVGTNEAEGRRILEEAGIPFLDSMEEAAERAMTLASQVK